MLKNPNRFSPSLIRRLFHSTLSFNSQENPRLLSKPQLKALVLSNFSKGKFFNLIQNVVASPSVLLSAAGNLIPGGDAAADSSALHRSVARHFSIEEMSREISENRFDFASHLLKIEGRGESLIILNLKLKVFIEAIRVVLEIVYDDRFFTFSYGGRVNMGRHTAIRYLKNSVKNPSWWFTVCFHRAEFDSAKIDKLCLIMEEKIEDRILIDVIKKLFECGALRIELGAFYLGRGLPQECGLSAIMLNVYFNVFDRKIQEMRLKFGEKSAKIESSERAYYKPVNIYAVRYLDEILMVTSGSKIFTMDLKNEVLKILEQDLLLKVDRVKTAIHSSVSEKIEFLGMELQAVPPSVLHPPPSEKALRARKKYIRQKEVKALEMRNARERNRKKLGMKILSHVYKKSKQSNGFKFDFQIENEVREIFGTWGDETVREFLGSLEERMEWYRMLTAGDFLNLRHIRDQLPVELVNAYDKFQQQVRKHISPFEAIKEIEAKRRKEEEEEERKYAERTVEDLTKPSLKVSAPIELVRKAVKWAGFTNNMGRPRPISFLLALEDVDIIKWYAGVGKRWLDFFCCCHNLKMVKTVVSYHLRFSCILTLAEKHEATKMESIRHYTKDLKVSDENGDEEVHFPTEREVRMMGDRNLSDPKPVDGALALVLIRMPLDECSHSCIAHFCDRKDTVLYRLRLLKNVVSENSKEREKWNPGMAEIHECLDRICLPLCSDHIGDLYTGKITLQDIDCASFVNVE